MVVGGLNGFREKAEEVSAELAAGFDDGQDGLDESAAGGTLRSEAELAPDHRVSQRPLAGVVRRFDARHIDECPQPIAMLPQRRAHAL